jgi:hypothetical protein
VRPSYVKVRRRGSRYCCAGIDIPQWYRWKQSAGIYFLSRAKDLFKFTCYGEIDFDREDPVNLGVIADQLVTNATSQVTFRYIKYQCPHTGAEYEFVTNHMKIRPGVLAWLYKRRWDIEKTYDTFKNKMNESKAWAKSANAKNMQAQFICLAHNLMVLMDQDLSSKQQIKNQKEIDRCLQPGDVAQQSAKEQGGGLSLLYLNPLTVDPQICTMVRYHLAADSPIGASQRIIKTGLRYVLKL